MATIGYHASHEQFTPSDLLGWVVRAEQAGFRAINSSDHFHPWSESQGQSGFSFAWLGAAMQATKLPFGVVCAPGQRYHPAIVAQATATLSQMFPGRFWISLGSGEALNENITGERWITKEERNARLKECGTVIKRLLQGEQVTHFGYTRTQEAKLYTRPSVQPLLLGAAVSKKTAGWMGSWAEGLITVSRPLPELKQVVRAFREGGGEGKPLYLKVQLSYDRSLEKALKGAHEQWRCNVLPADILDDLWQVSQFDAAARFVREEDMRQMVLISTDHNEYIDTISAYADLGFEKIILHNVNREQEQFIGDFGEKVLPALH
ncbi:MAG TPA: TIGR03885 family FMN-dependent LLM class oxidoreductase [Flavisolibacter sp.]|nr:TIGR03885 family FMN-dependent LLM class oxidoreductase [Flavisolibacter sp.]